MSCWLVSRSKPNLFVRQICKILCSHLLVSAWQRSLLRRFTTLNSYWTSLTTTLVCSTEGLLHQRWCLRATAPLLVSPINWLETLFRLKWLFTHVIVVLCESSHSRCRFWTLLFKFSVFWFDKFNSILAVRSIFHLLIINQMRCASSYLWQVLEICWHSILLRSLKLHLLIQICFHHYLNFTSNFICISIEVGLSLKHHLLSRLIGKGKCG